MLVLAAAEGDGDEAMTADDSRKDDDQTVCSVFLFALLYSLYLYLLMPNAAFCFCFLRKGLGVCPH